MEDNRFRGGSCRLVWRPLASRFNDRLDHRSLTLRPGAKAEQPANRSKQMGQIVLAGRLLLCHVPPIDYFLE
ncbi:hypothetical protein RISK_001715 [Rhodopirellula islandica]|uniref:Uncharacterized protein n=1 Tax=Rhodopirellula islandica TaxID=595434 RepID=A0A0J1ELU8_RHOIS|nr:hypothetical protein [Rhodopirellula islandica]KLU06504.1 hypothetical protein RISK_001715 [Rhodopirellula islandica]